LLLAVLVACESGPTAPQGPPQHTGPILQAGDDLARLGYVEGDYPMWVNEDPSNECGGYVFAVDSESWIADSRGDLDRREAGTDILVPGAVVEVWFDLILDTCPGRSYAEAVNRIE